MRRKNFYIIEKHRLVKSGAATFNDESKVVLLSLKNSETRHRVRFPENPWHGQFRQEPHDTVLIAKLIALQIFLSPR